MVARGEGNGERKEIGKVDFEEIQTSSCKINESLLRTVQYEAYSK